MPPPDCRLGVDVGGTNTDAVIMDAAGQLIAKAKVPGTPDITAGIVAAIEAVLGAPGADPGRISHVMLGTTHATNAILERANLRRVAVLRIGGPATYSIRPMFGWPPDLVEAISAGATIVDGGIEFDGRDLPARHRRHRAVPRPGRRRGRRRRDHQRVRPGLDAARAAGRRGGQA